MGSMLDFGATLGTYGELKSHDVETGMVTARCSIGGRGLQQDQLLTQYYEKCRCARV